MLRLSILIFGYQVIILLVAFIFGQFAFFWNYEKKILRLFARKKTAVQKMNKIAIFASGAGSNAQKIIDHFRNHPSAQVSLIVCNKPGAGIISIAQKENIPVLMLEKEKFFRGDAFVPDLKAAGINFIVLAGFLWKVPAALITAFPSSIINIHPALLPAYGGKGMYGSAVHQAVIANKESQSGITIHYVDDHYDHGDIIFQQTCTIEPHDTPESLAQKIHILEHANYPKVIEETINLQNRR